MKIAVICLTCGRPEFTRQTWAHNFANHGGGDVSFYWYDNGSTEAERVEMEKETPPGGFDLAHFSATNKGIAPALNYLLREAFQDGADYVCTMANDILEPDGWLLARADAAEAVDKTGAVAIPVGWSQRYPSSMVNGWRIEQGTIIGNWLITRECYEQLGGFCTDYGIYGPLDLDYCDRMRAAGFRFYYIHDIAKAEHLGDPKENPPKYEAVKKKSLAASWELFHKNRKIYKAGAKIYQND